MWREYHEGKQTYFQLAIKHNCFKRIIQRKIVLYQVTLPQITAREVVVVMDSTYWGRNFGVMLFKDDITKENLLKYNSPGKAFFDNFDNIVALAS